METLCAFCDPEELDWRTIRKDAYMRSIVSNPRFRRGQSLVIPNRHIFEVGELEDAEAASIMKELGRLGMLLDQGFGSGVMQKYQPLQAENGIKVSHLHFHVFPRVLEEVGLFPVPEPNSFDGFTKDSPAEVLAVVEGLK
jgi:histidine triad (HIT) family protein